MGSGNDFALFGIDDVAIQVFHHNNSAFNVFIQRVGRFGMSVFQRHYITQNLSNFTDIRNGLRSQVGHVKIKQGFQFRVGLNGLLNAGILYQLVGEFRRIHRVKRILIF